MPDRPSTPLYSLTTLSLLSREMEEATLAGIPHADIKLEAREYKIPTFSQTLLGIIRALRVPTWDLLAPELECIKISKVSGALTNAVFSISYADITPSRSPPPSMHCAGSPSTQTIVPCTVLLRIYGSSASKLIARSDELRILYTLSSIHRIGPRVFGTFRNGRIEEWFDSTPLTIKDIRDPAQSQWIGMRIRELHNIDVRSIVGSTWNGQESVLRDILFWKGGAQEVLDILKAKEDKGEIDPEHPWSGAREKLDLALFTSAWEAYWTWVRRQEGEYGRSEMVLAHNDLREGNLLRTYGLTPGILNHHQIIIIDFEYAAPNPAAFDIASHFNEWATNYNRPDVSHLTTSYQYPTREERCNFYLGYLRPVPRAQPVVLPASQTSVDPLVHSSRGSPVSFVPNLDETEPGLDDIEQTSSTLDAQVLAWSPASHAYCTVWAIVQAHQDVMTGAIGEFDHLGYAMGRLEKFYEDLKQRGIRW